MPVKMPKIHQCRFVEVSDLVPKSWVDWFWGLISENAPFSWGDNNRSMVTADDFARYCEERLDGVDDVSEAAKRRWLDSIYALGQTYIDLEN